MDLWVLEGIDPYGERRDDLRVAKMVADIANMLGVTRGGQRLSALDYVLDFEPPAPVPVEEQVKTETSKWLIWAKVHNALVSRRNAQVKNLKKLGA